MPNLVHVTYDQTGKSKSTNALGMREMQEKAYEGRTAQYLLLKAPPASALSSDILDRQELQILRGTINSERVALSAPANVTQVSLILMVMVQVIFFCGMDGFGESKKLKFKQQQRQQQGTVCKLPEQNNR